MTETKELINWCEYKMKKFERESTSVHPDEERIKQIRAKLEAAEKMKEALRIVAYSGYFSCFEDKQWDVVNDALTACEEAGR